MPKKEIEIAAQHFAPANAAQSGTLTFAGTMAEEGDSSTAAAIANGTLTPAPLSKKEQTATLIKASKQFMAQSASLGEVPKQFDKDKYYRVQLTQTVLDHAGNCLRPADDVMILGAFAEEIADFISGATEI